MEELVAKSVRPENSLPLENKIGLHFLTEIYI